MDATAASIRFTILPLSPLSKLPLSTKPSLHFRVPISTLPLIQKFHIYPSNTPSIIRRPSFEVGCSNSVEEVALLENENINETEDGNLKRKLYVVNLPWSLTPDDIKKAFTQCGTVKEVELIKNKNGTSRGFAFVTMSSGDEAKTAVDKFHLQELSGRTIKVEFARRLKKPRPQAQAQSQPGPETEPQPPAVVPVTETRHKLYVSNLQWKVRSNDLREFFSSNFKPVSTRVVFEKTSKRSAGYGFVSFATREEAEAAVSSLDGQDLLGRPVRLKFSVTSSENKERSEENDGDNLNKSSSEPSEEVVLDEQPEMS